VSKFIEAQASSATSPFERIRRERVDGSEYWSARELMVPLGYGQWRRFKDAIERAEAACANSGNAVTSNFAGAGKINSSGRSSEDVHLSRYGAYLVAMNGDPRKPEIAAAQTYFAVKTREAEALPRTMTFSQDPVPVRNTDLAAIRALVDAIEDTRAEQERLALAQDELGDRVLETEDRLASIEGRRDRMTAVAYSRQFGLPAGHCTHAYLNHLGRVAARVGKAQGLEPEKARDEKYGWANMWPVAIWDAAYAEKRRSGS